jgi:hypothetical protein
MKSPDTVRSAATAQAQCRAIILWMQLLSEEPESRPGTPGLNRDVESALLTSRGQNDCPNSTQFSGWLNR